MTSTSDNLGRIILIENDYGNRILFTDYLEHCGYSVLPLVDGMELLEILEKVQPSLLMLNLKLSGIDGFSIIETLRRHDTWYSLPILVVSGYTLQADKQKAYDLGADAYLVKPVLPSDLRLAVEQLLRSR
ncbi:response regulator [Romeria aff. gracilis LEGE 07310]|uniref:Response regulator n=1 Tax=Vasconcelosia minhoensis LEGE 07310 TaxID=915328 RepID=A0A8J7AHN0_9CYAN|nr:response regulator [Romeria gracilis]MBE9077728.1 response regulator [Romeria aff. gracilis LEGE 07310]